MARTQVTGREVSDKSIFFADIDLTTAAVHPSLVPSDRFLLVDPTDGEIKTSTLTNLYTVLNTKYLQLTGGTVSGALIVSGTTTLNALTKVGTALVTNLNADLLDNLHASYFAPANHTHPDTMVYPGEGIALSDGRSWLRSIENKSDNWNEAYSWGNHAGLYAPVYHGHSYEPIITAGTTSQYWRGDKTWRTLPATTQVLYMSGVNIVGSAGFQYKVASGDFCAGTSAQAVGGNTIALGTSSVAYGDGALAIGYGASCLGLHSVAIGTYTDTSSDYSVMIGLEASCQGDNAVAIGKNAIAYNDGDITIGSTMASNLTSIFGAILFPHLTGVGDRILMVDAAGNLLPFTGTIPTQYWQLSSGILSPVANQYHLSINENQFYAGHLFIKKEGPALWFRGYSGAETYLNYLASAGNINFYAFNDGSYNILAASITTRASLLHSKDSIPTELVFSTANLSGSAAERMIIRAGGMVEISKSLYVNTSNDSGTQFSVYSTGAIPSLMVSGTGAASINTNTLLSTLNIGGSLSVKSRFINTANQTLGHETFTYINAGATSLYLVAANTAVDRMYFVANLSASAVTLRVATNDALNGVTNGTFSIKSQGLTIIQQGLALSSVGWYAYELR